MVDNVPVSGATIATDDVAGVQYQRIKLDGGGDGVSLPLIARTAPSPANTAALPIREIGQNVWSSGFSLTQPTLDSSWVELLLGPGVGRSQANSNLLITTGTTATSEFLARSVETFSGAMLMRARASLSQRIANQNCVVMLADRLGDGLAYTALGTALTVSLPAHGLTTGHAGQSVCCGAIAATTGNGVPGRYAIASVPDENTLILTVSGWTDGDGTLSLFGRNYVRVVYQGTSATSAAFDVAQSGWADTPVTATVSTTAGVGHQFQVHLDGRNAYLADSTVASTTVPNMTTRASRTEYAPTDAIQMHVYLWCFNGAVAPASTTTWTLGAISVEDYANFPVYIAGQRQQGTTAPAPVQITSSVAIGVVASASANAIGDVGVQYRANATGAATIRHIVSAATTNATIVKNAAGRLLGWSLTNTSAALKFVKFHNQATTPTAGAGVVHTIAIPPGVNVALSLSGGIAFATGIGMTIVNGAPDNDTTVVAVADVVGDLYFA